MTTRTPIGTLYSDGSVEPVKPEPRETHEERCKRLGIPSDATDICEGRYVTSYTRGGLRCSVHDLM